MTRLDELKAKQAKALEEAEREEAVRGTLPGGHPWRVFATGGGVPARFWLSLEASRDYTPTLETVAEMGKALQPAPLAKVSGGCVSFQPRTSPIKDGRDSLNISPFVLEAKGACSYQSSTITIRWWAVVCSQMCRVSITLPAPYSGELGMVRHEVATGRKHHQKAGDILSASYSQPPGLAGGLTLETGEPMAIAERVSWWRPSGSPGMFTTYFVPLGTHAATIGDLIRNLKGGQ